MKVGKILLAGGLVDIREHMGMRREIILTAQKMRSQLGAQSNLVDKYLIALLSALSKITVLDAVDEGFQDASTELRILIAGIRTKKAEATEHPFYPAAKAFMEKRVCPSDDIYTDFYCACLSLEYAEFALERYMKNREDAVRSELKKAGIDTLEADLTQRVNPADLDRLFDLICSRFLIAPPSRIFLQCMIDQCVLSNITRDKEGRFVLQHMLDGEAD